MIYISVIIQTLTDLNVPYDNKIYGNVIDPTEWNNNFTTIETVLNGNNDKINSNFENVSDAIGELSNNILPEFTSTDSGYYLLSGYYHNQLWDWSLRWKKDDTEKNTNKVTSISSLSTDAQYPSAKCVYDLVGNIESALSALR